MNRETIIQMAREAGFDLPTDGDDFDYPQEIERLIHLATAKEREECAKVCERIDLEYEGEDVHATWCAAAIRARGESVGCNLPPTESEAAP